MADNPTKKHGADDGPSQLRISAGAALFALVSLFLVYLAFQDSGGLAVLSLVLLVVSSIVIWGEADKRHSGSLAYSFNLIFRAALAVIVLSSIAQAVAAPEDRLARWTDGPAHLVLIFSIVALYLVVETAERMRAKRNGLDEELCKIVGFFVIFAALLRTASAMFGF